LKAFLFQKKKACTHIQRSVSFVSEEELVTPPLDGLILPGAVRRSVIELANGMKDKKFKVSERKITMKEVADAAEKGRV
jgi:branched-chain amino acid aminotransferase